MKTILIPVDFTATSDNAVNFAAEWSRKYEYNRIILLKTFYDSMFENMVIAAEFSRVNQDFQSAERTEGEERLKQLCEDLQAKTGNDIRVLTATSELPLLRAVIQVIEEEGPELLILGSDNYTYSSESFIAGNLIGLAKASPVRVLIVPAAYKYRPVKEALVPFDFRLVHTLEKVNHLRKAPQWNDIKLLVLNINSKLGVERPQASEVEKLLHSYLQNFPHELYYENDKNIINGIMTFIDSHPVDLIIALPGQRSFLYSLTHKSISRGIFLNAKQPVLILK